MSTKQNTNKSNNNEPSFDEYRAYEELRMIFVIAIETQDFTTLEARIAAWEKRYPLAEFTDSEIIRKIKAILNKDFLARLLGDYLAAKILHEQEKQKKAYDSLKSIIDSAKKSKDYKTAQKEVRKWKDTLYNNGYTLSSFNRLYRARICTLLLLPAKELKNQEQATDELKKIKENGTSMDSKNYFEAISNWQNTYSIADFPEKLRKELNQITTEVFDSISQKRTGENAILEIENMLSTKDISNPLDAMSSILSKYDYRCFDSATTARIQSLCMEAVSIQDTLLTCSVLDISISSSVSPIESNALSSLKDILKNTPHDMDAILNWIYVNRKVSYSEIARNEIISQFSSVGYKIPEQSSFSIPEINPHINYRDLSKVDELRKTVILNYLGIISQGSKLTIEGKDNLIEAHTISANESISKKDNSPVMFLEAYDTIVEHPEAEDEKKYGENIQPEEETIFNIFIEDIIDNPLATYSIEKPSVKLSQNTSKNQITLEEPEKVQETGSDQIPEIETADTDLDTKTTLSVQDNENLEKAHDLSTYVIVSTPILVQTLNPKRKSLNKKQKFAERTF